MSLNKVMLIGNVGRDPEIRHLANSSIVARFPLATSEKFKTKTGELQEQTEWHNIVCWRLLAERAEKYVKKGSQVFVEGKIRSREWVDQTEQKRSVIEIVAESFQLLGKRADSQPSVQNIQPVTTSAAVVGDDLPDDLPF